MFDVAPTELLLVAVVALVVIGPKDLPKTMRVVGQWVGRARGMARHFRSGFDQMVREAELEEMEKRWATENARIMSEHPPTPEMSETPALPLHIDGELVGHDAPADHPVTPETDGSPELPLQSDELHYSPQTEEVVQSTPAMRPLP